MNVRKRLGAGWCPLATLGVAGVVIATLLSGCGDDDENPGPPPGPRFTDNGDGTIIDRQSGLQWEKKVKFDHVVDLANLQDADNLYPWAGTCSGSGKLCQATAGAATLCAAGVEGDPTGCAQCTEGDGTCDATVTAWTWLAALNTANFANHRD